MEELNLTQNFKILILIFVASWALLSIAHLGYMYFKHKRFMVGSASIMGGLTVSVIFLTVIKFISLIILIGVITLSTVTYGFPEILNNTKNIKSVDGASTLIIIVGIGLLFWVSDFLKESLEYRYSQLNKNKNKRNEVCKNEL